MQSAGKDSSANTMIHPHLQNIVFKLIIKKWQTRGLVLDKTWQCQKAELTDDKLEDIQAWLQISPQKSLKQLS